MRAIKKQMPFDAATSKGHEGISKIFSTETLALAKAECNNNAQKLGSISQGGSL
jgi:hypothetical protein